MASALLLFMAGLPAVKRSNADAIDRKSVV